MKEMNKLFVFGLGLVIVIGCISGVTLMNSSLLQSNHLPQELDFTVTGTNDCLRFLNSSVSTVYIPIATGVNEQWELTINATKMAGGPKAWVDLYKYEGYWDAGTNFICKSKDVYPILTDIESADAQVNGGAPYVKTYGSSNAETQTLFFIFPPGGQSTFHVTLKEIK
jgi:hypothetical protein